MYVKTLKKFDSLINVLFFLVHCDGWCRINGKHFQIVKVCENFQFMRPCALKGLVARRK